MMNPAAHYPPEAWPAVPTYAERHRDGNWDLLITCPHCGAIHRHGGGAGRLPSLGNRVGHCVERDRAGDYILVTGPAGMARPVARPRVGRGKPLHAWLAR